MIFFCFSKNSEFWIFLVYPTVVSVLRSASVERCFVSRMRDFFLHDGQGVGQGGADVSQLQDCDSVACGGGGEGGRVPGQGWSRRGWAGWRSFSICFLVNTLAQRLALI